MRFLYIGLFFLVFSFSSCNSSQAQNDTATTTEVAVTTYYFIRHAEKDRSDAENRNPELTEAGHARAKRWMEAFKDVPLDAVYSTDYNRTQQTAAPTAKSKSLEVLSYNPRTLNDTGFATATKGKTVLVVGHSNTTPSFVNAVLGTDTYPQIDDSNNGNLYIVRVAGSQKEAQLLHLN